MINMNLQTLRKARGLTQEEVAEKTGVSRQAVAKWENGESLPDISNCTALARLYNISLDTLVNGEPTDGLPFPPKGKHIFGTVTVGERGQIVIPKKAREIFRIKSGDSLLVLGDENQGGLALIEADAAIRGFEFFMQNIKPKGKKNKDDKSEEGKS